MDGIQLDRARQTNRFRLSFTNYIAPSRPKQIDGSVKEQ
jgi:hypothetical protein